MNIFITCPFRPLHVHHLQLPGNMNLIFAVCGFKLSINIAVDFPEGN